MAERDGWGRVLTVLAYAAAVALLVSVSVACVAAWLPPLLSLRAW